MKTNKFIMIFLALLVILSTVLQPFSNSAYANNDEYKIKNIEDYKTDKEVLNARIDEDLSTNDHKQIKVSITQETKEIIFVFQKLLNFREDNVLPDNMEVDKDYKDKGLYGKNYTSMRLINKDTKEKNDESNSTSKEIKEVSIKFDVANKLQSGELFAAISDGYVSISVLKNKDTNANTDTNEKVSKIADKATEKSVAKTSEVTTNNNIDKTADKIHTKDNPLREQFKKYEDNATKEPNILESLDSTFNLGVFRAARGPIVIETYVKFAIVSNTGESIKGQIGYKLMEIQSNGVQRPFKQGFLNTEKKEIVFTGLKLNTTYKFYITSVPPGYDRPVQSVAEFYFDTTGIHFTKGSGGIVLQSNLPIALGYFITDTSGKAITDRGAMRFELKKETSSGETNINVNSIPDVGVVNKINIELNRRGIELNTKYKLYVTRVPNGFQRPERSVSEFYFTAKDGNLFIYYTKGGTTIVLKRIGEQDKPLGDNEYYGFVGVEDKIKISKDYDNSSGMDAFCFRADDTFPDFGGRVVYTKLMVTPDELYNQAQNPRVGKKELYDAIRKIYYYCETHKEELLTNYGLNNKEFWETTNHKQDHGYYRAVQEAVWYYSNSFNTPKNYPEGSKLHDIMKNAVNHIIRESAKVSEKDMNSVKIQIFKTYKTTSAGEPYQSLVTFELEKNTDINVLKLGESDTALKGAVFKLEKLADNSFTPIYKGENENISEFKFKGLTVGKYRLTETQAPKGYKLLGEPIDFQIEENSGTFNIKLLSSNPKVIIDSSSMSITVKNEKNTTSITVNKKWFTTDGREKQRNEGSITYNLIQVSRTNIGRTMEKVYKSQKVLTSNDNWTVTYTDLPLAGVNDEGDDVTYSYYVEENTLPDYSTSYINSSGKESRNPANTAITSGTITIKNTEKMKFILPETGGMGRLAIYLIGTFLLGISIFMTVFRRNFTKIKTK